MILKDKLPAPFTAEITASDISLKSLMVGKAGFYPESRIVGIPDAYLNRFFERKNNGYQAREEIMKMIRFDYHNLKNDSGQRNIDILFCRNVLILLRRGRSKGGYRPLLGCHVEQVVSVHRALGIPFRHENEVRVPEDRVGLPLPKKRVTGCAMDALSVLIVDDSALMRSLIAKIIEATPGLAVADKAMNGRFALEKLARTHPDVIVLDIEMPDMNGIDFLRERKRLGIDIPVVILSSIAKEGARVTMECLELGASDL
jgi:CheY-like chemotaxis protein